MAGGTAVCSLKLGVLSYLKKSRKNMEEQKALCYTHSTLKFFSKIDLLLMDLYFPI